MGGLEESGVRWTLPAVPASVPTVRRGVAEILGPEVAHESADEIRLAVTEACSNVVRHAYEGKDGVLEVVVRRDGNALVVDVRDAGIGLPPNPRPTGDGLGLKLIAALAQTVTITARHPGTSVRMRFALTRS